MKTNLFALGLLFATLAPLCAQDKIPFKPVLSSQNGRYAFGQVIDSYSHIYMLDTQTGRLWRAAFSTNGSEITLKPVMFRMEDGTLSPLPGGPMKEPYAPLHKTEKPLPKVPAEHSGER